MLGTSNGVAASVAPSQTVPTSPDAGPSAPPNGEETGLGNLLGGRPPDPEDETHGTVERELINPPLSEGVDQVASEERPALAPNGNGKAPQPAADGHPTIHGKMSHFGHAMLGQRLRDGKGLTVDTNDAARAADGQQSATSATPAPHTGDGVPTPAQIRWQALKRRLQSAKKTRHNAPAHTRAEPDLTQELSNGVLPVMVLKMGIERDESDDPRVPVLLNHLKIKVTGSSEAGAQAGHAIFRIDLSYGDGLNRWVVYREMRDFVNLQIHYRAASLRGRLGIKRPDGHAVGPVGDESQVPPLPKWKHNVFRNRDAPAASDQTMRAQLEDWLHQICRMAALRPDANRLCKFLEVSALSLALAGQSGAQGKQGFLNVLSPVSRKGSHRSVTMRLAARKHLYWCMVRESYLLLAEHPGSLKVSDVFLFDMDFRITRPRRIYRHPLPTLKDHSDEGDNTDEEEVAAAGGAAHDMMHQQDLAAFLAGGAFTAMQEGKDVDDSKGHGVSAHTFYLTNSHQKLKLVARNERQMYQFVGSIRNVAKFNSFAGPNRFDSFAPIRYHVNATPLIDGRDYYWAVSKALARAKDRIMIHDWWLSPELYLRRPGRPGFRLDTILRQKAEEGVKVFVILYNEVSNSFTPTDSNYSKQRLINLHKNIMVQRSPSHFQTGTFYWAHHEKLCVVDETIAFMGGFDLCFGRWDTHDHVLTDNVRADPDQTGVEYEFDDPRLLGPIRRTPSGPTEANIWPGQDYANERVTEWSVLNRPEEDLFSRDKYPRMPWHDVGMQLVGQPARDLARHFIQRWNYLLRIKNHTREMPFLLPPPDFTPEDLHRFGLTGTCEAQICRSAGPWSLGTTERTEHSIQNAYLKAIENSEHFVYIENQFFITSSMVETTQIENHIGDALIDRILRADHDGTPWKAIIVMPLIPGFPLPIDHPDASSVRLIVEAQYRSICRGKLSIFGRLQSHGIDPTDYISFYGLRNWGRLRNGAITTEQIYPHDKICIVDDRLVICGSANINERSQRGDRDSELAVVLLDTDMVDSTMAGQPYKVGRMPHDMRVKLMQEHLGIDVDALQAPAPTEETTRPHTPHGHSDAKPGQGTTASCSEGLAAAGANGTRTNSTPSATPPLQPEQSATTVQQRLRRQPQGHFALPSPPVAINATDFEDPIDDDFYYEKWAAIAERNTILYRRALRVVPDDTVKTWSEYKWFLSYTDRLAKAQEEFAQTVTHSATASTTTAVGEEGAPLPPSQGNAAAGPGLVHGKAATENVVPENPGEDPLLPGTRDSFFKEKDNSDNPAVGATPQPPPGTTSSGDFSPADIAAIGKLVENTQGHLVQFPLRWLEQESYSCQLLFASDTLLPLSIFF